MLERDIQERFVGFINGAVDIPQPDTNPLRIYKELVHYRFDEVLRNAMPDFCEILGEKRLDLLIFEFIQSKPKTPYIWQVPTLFMHFLIESSKVDDIRYAADLMWFESVEVELLMGQYHKPAQNLFDWNSSFKPSSSMRMKLLNYPVNQGCFDFVESHPLIMYYSFQEYSVFYQEITPFMFRFLSYLEYMMPKEALMSICADFDINEEDEVKELLQGALENFSQLNIIEKSSKNDRLN